MTTIIHGNQGFSQTDLDRAKADPKIRAEVIALLNGEETEDARFEGNDFAIQIIATGEYIDNGVGNGKSYTVQATTIRLNHVALGKWVTSAMMNVRDCYEDGPEGDAQWEAHKAEYAARRVAWEKQIKAALGIDENTGSFHISQAVSEVFTVVCIWENV